MVAKKSIKAAKATYTDRVLGALSQIQQEKRSQSIHMATLRAQVRKNAEAQQDHLGPQWPQWVGKAVNRLVEEGVLHASDHSVRVAVTPKGKKLFTARRSSMDTGSPSALSRGFHNSPTTAHKRGRRSTRLFQAEQEPGGDGSPVSKKARLAPRAKKAKRAKLAEFESLQQSVSANFDLHREMSPLTDVEAEDPEMTTLMATPQAYRLKGVVRTQSGSIIPDHSKQPTPAPSSPGSEIGGVSYLDQDTFGGGPVMDQPNDETTALIKELEQQKLAMDLMKQTSEKEKQVSSLRISQLEKQLSTFRTNYDQLRFQVDDTLGPRITSQVAEIEVKNQEITRLRAAQQELQASFQRVPDLEGQVERLHALLSDYQATNDTAQVELAALRNTSSEQETAIRMKEQEARDLQNTIATLQSSNAEMEGKAKSYAAQVVVLNATVQELRAAISLHQERVKATEEQTMKLEVALQNKEKEKSAFETTLMKVQEELDLTKQEKGSTVASLNAEIQSLQLTTQTLRHEHQDQISALEAALQDARAMLRQSEEFRDTQLQEKESELTGAKEQSKETLSLLRNDFRALKNSQMKAWEEMEAKFEAILTRD